jgi:hypothetical protein
MMDKDQFDQLLAEVKEISTRVLGIAVIILFIFILLVVYLSIYAI